jgi:XRE family transcriptional regulator, regulator of sulfur utilization
MWQQRTTGAQSRLLRSTPTPCPGDALRELRQARDLTQETLGDRSDLTTNYVGDAERGGRNISVRALWQLADGLGVPASELLREAERHAKK